MQHRCTVGELLDQLVELPRTMHVYAVPPRDIAERVDPDGLGLLYDIGGCRIGQTVTPFATLTLD